jgi:adenine-specific DNA-methyltransferase
MKKETQNDNSKKLGQIFTPSAVASFMVKLYDGQKQAKTLDPCFGDGAFLRVLKEQGFSSVSGIEIDKKLFSDTKTVFPDFRLERADFLSKSFDEKFDFIIMNPPYIRHEKFPDLQRFGMDIEKIRKDQAFSGLPRKANLYAYFIIKALDVLSDPGILIAIFPSTWTRDGTYLFKAIKGRGFVCASYHINGLAFGDNVLVSVDIVIFKKRFSPLQKSIVRFSSGQTIVEKIEDNPLKDSKNTIAIKEVFQVKRGLTTGDNDFYINGCRGKFVQWKMPILLTPKGIKNYKTTNANWGDILIPNTSPYTLRTYFLKYKNAIQKTEKPVVLYRLISSGKKDWYHLHYSISKKETIVFGYIIRNNMKFIITDRPGIIKDNFYVLNPSFDPMLAMALLNNFFVYLRLELVGKNYGGGMLKIQRYDLSDTKIINPSSLSNEDKLSLIILGNELVKTSNGNDCIEQITRILCLYEGVNFDTIKERYSKSFAERLKR